MKTTEGFDLCEWIRKSYKKFKSSVYFDRTNAPVRERIIHFESAPDWGSLVDLDPIFDKMAGALMDENPGGWEAYQSDILKNVRAFCYPKTLLNEKEAAQSGGFFTTAKNSKVFVNKLQYMIDMPVEGHILGALWILLCGYQIDSALYEHAYGNRIRKTLLNELTHEPTYSPHLFEPYFQQYQSWRDTALEDAQSCLRQDSDVVILTLDLKRYYYSVDVTTAVMKQIVDEVDVSEEKALLVERLSLFIAEVCRVYAQQLPESERGNRSVLPIGFLPSNILGNWFLTRFDQAVVDHWNPLYYGRYVDDILIVDKVESNSDIGKKAKAEELTKENVIQFFLLQCTKWPGILDKETYKCSGNYALLCPSDKAEKKYFINTRYLPSSCHCEVELQNEKINIFYFQRGESDALLECFKQNIGRNASEFRHMPEADAVFHRNDYHEIYSLTQKGINKLRDVEKVEVDKFNLSKFLGKYLRIGGMVDDSAEHEFERDLEKIFNYQTAIENYPLWERVAEILVMNEKFEALSRFSIRVREAIAHLETKERNIEPEIRKVKNTLYQVQLTGLTKALSLCWKPVVEEFSKEFMNSLQDDAIEFYTVYDHAINTNHRAAWLRCRMADKSVMPVLPDLLLTDNNTFWSNKLGANLTRFGDVLRILALDADGQMAKQRLDELPNYKYPPYMVTMHELSIAQVLIQLLSGNMPMATEDYQIQRRIYMASNYQKETPGNTPGPIDARTIPFGMRDPLDCALIKVGCNQKETLRVALANVHLDSNILVHALDRRPDRTYQRYQEVSKIVNHALDEKADMLIMPEAFLPFEWLPILARTCAKNQMAVVTGVEHLVVHNVVYNLTATILPFEDNDYRCAQVCFHLKNHYAPGELEELERFKLESPKKTATRYELYCWDDCWFSVYCCFELCSIQERSLFQSYADFLVAVEWNRDVTHYGNIIESLARDMHCYCIQVNESQYGDSRIVIPIRTEERDLVRVKGGKNSVVLVDEIDIKQLRDFQFTGHSKLKFKPLPPEFDRDRVNLKRKQALFETLK